MVRKVSFSGFGYAGRKKIARHRITKITSEFTFTTVFVVHRHLEVDRDREDGYLHDHVQCPGGHKRQHLEKQARKRKKWNKI